MALFDLTASDGETGKRNVKATRILDSRGFGMLEDSVWVYDVLQGDEIQLNIHLQLPIYASYTNMTSTANGSNH